MSKIWKKEFTIAAINHIGKKTMLEHLGIEFTECGEDFLMAKMPVDDRTVQPARILHGGASAVLAESLGSVASSLCVADNESVVGLEINANHLKSATNGYVVGRVQPIRLGSRVHVWNIEIKNENGDLTCVSRLTVMVQKKVL